MKTLFVALLFFTTVAFASPPDGGIKPGTVTVATENVKQVYDGDLIFNVGGSEALRFKPDGTVLIHGKKAANDPLVYAAFRTWLSEVIRTQECGRYDNYNVSTGRLVQATTVAAPLWTR